MLLLSPPRAVRLTLLLAFCIPSLVFGQQFVSNPFVGGRVDGGGLVTIYRGNPSNRNLLTYIDKSYLTLKINGLYYSNNENADLIGPNATIQPVDVSLSAGQPFKVQDTLRTIWKEKGFDIVQDVFPVQFENSGVVVISVKIVNHTNSVIPVQAQFLLDNMNSDPDSSNDNPFLITRYGYIRNWQDNPPGPVPSFYLAFEHPPTDSVLGTVGIGYENDTFPPRPLGLVQPVAPSFIEFGDWPTQVQYTWGPPGGGITRNTFTDEAALLMGNPLLASSYLAGESDSVTEVFRTAYGVPEWCYDHGHLFGFALYPHHLYWDPAQQTYTPNPFKVEAFLFPVGNNGASKTTVRQTIGDPIRIVSPRPTGLAKDTTEAERIPGISADGFAYLEWEDSAIVLPNGCAASFPVDVNFQVQAGAVDTPIFYQPWDCSITVDCPNPDTIPPRYQNSFAGCDSIQHDTITVEDNYFYDLGLDSISYRSPDMTPAQYRVTFGSQSPYLCTKTPVTIFVTQVDTFQGGHVIFTFTDCAGNVSHDTICFTAHAAIPDLTAPQFWLTTPLDCHDQCTALTVTDTDKSATSIDQGVDSIIVVSSTNMSASGIPPGGKYPAGTPTTTIHACVTDSMQDGIIVFLARDTAGNKRLDTITYCTTPDTTPPVLTHGAFNPATGTWQVHLTDSGAWDRGIDSVWVVTASNVTITPSPIPNPIGCKPSFDLVVRVTDTTQCAQATIRAQDCAGNISTLLQLSFSKGVKPVITASKTILCSDTDAAVLDAGGPYGGYEWSTGDTTRTITVHKAGSYTVTVDDGIGCSATSDPVTITLSPATPNIVPAGPIILCAPDSAELDAGAGFNSYQWYNDGMVLSGETSQTIWARATGKYTVQVTNAAGCSGTSPAVSVTINPLPAQPVITSANDTLASTTAATYQWSQDGTPIAGATGQTYVPQTGGTFTVTITDSNGCSSTSEPFSNAGSTVVAVPSMVVAKESQSLTIPLSILSSQSLPQGVNRSFTAVLRFNKTMLVPQDGSFVSKQVQGSDLVVTYTGSSSVTQGVLLNLPFTAALGDDSCTTVTIDSFRWSTPNISITRQNGNFCLTGLCTQGGTRLVNPEGAVTLSQPIPNPAFNSIEIDYNLIEQGHTTITLYDVLGHEVMSLVDDDQKPGAYSVVADISSLPAGRYIYTLRTPTIVESQNLQILR